MTSSVLEPARNTGIVSESPVETQIRSATIELRDISWELYCQLRDLEGNQAVRMHYADGVLHLMSPSWPHERIAQRLNCFVTYWALERRIPVESAGCVTLRKDGLKNAAEADGCFYIGDLTEIRANANIDLSRQRPPDLVIEVDVTSFSEHKLPIYARLGIPEVWRWQDGLHVLVRKGKAYAEQPDSAVLPGFPIAAVSRLLSDSASADLTATLEAFMQLIRGKRSH